jgi:hypothetical protein
LTLRDCHPKTGNSHLTIASRTFSGGVRLRVERTLASKITDEILQQPFEKMKLATYQMWTEDIAAGNYKVVKAESKESIPSPPSDSQSLLKDSSDTPDLMEMFVPM